MAKHTTPPKGEIPPDPFVASVQWFVDFARKNSRALIIAGVIVGLAIAGTLYYRNYQRSLEAQAATRFAELQGTIAAGNPQLAIRDLQGFVTRFGDATAARHARLILADLLLTEGRAEEALDVLGDMPRDLDDPQGVAAARLLASAHEAQDQPDQAVSVYLRLADAARFDYQRREALADAARVRLQTGSALAAADLYQRIVDTFEANEPGRGYYEMWAAEARAISARTAAAQE